MQRNVEQLDLFKDYLWSLRIADAHAIRAARKEAEACQDTVQTTKSTPAT